MPAQITGNNTSAIVTSVKLRVGVSTVIPVVGATRVYPVVDVAYILLVASAYLDTTGKFKYITDIFSIADLASLNTTKIVDADQFTLADTQVLSADKNISDTTTLVDNLTTVLIFIRDVNDVANFTDSKDLLVSPLYSDTVTISDASSVIEFGISKFFTDSFALNDLSDAAGPTFSFADFTNNAISTSDSSIVASTKVFSDSFSSADSGTLISQGYCDFTYFAEDYVGESRTF